MDAELCPQQPSCLCDTAVLTGESRPQRILPGGPVPAGAVLIDSEAYFIATTTAQGSRLGRLLQEVQAGRWKPTSLTTLVDRIQVWFTPVVLLVASLVAVGYYYVDPARAFDQAIAVILVCCPCALGLATPLTMTQLVLRAAAHNILIDNAGLMEVLDQPKSIILDKTGTITCGSLHVADWHWHDRYTNDTSIIYAMEALSSHPLARAVQSYLAERGETVPENLTEQVAAQWSEEIGCGLQAKDEAGNIWRIGKSDWIGCPLPVEGTRTVIGVSMFQEERKSKSKSKRKMKRARKKRGSVARQERQKASGPAYSNHRVTGPDSGWNGPTNSVLAESGHISRLFERGSIRNRPSNSV